MPNETPNLLLPYILQAQAQKHVTHNEAIRALDALVQISVLDQHLDVAPSTPADGARYIVGAGASGAWSGHAGEIAAFQDGAWAFFKPKEGWLAWIADEDKLYAFDGTVWIVAPAASTPVNPAPLIGVNATADTTNKLAVKSNAVLLSHDDVTPGTGDVRVVVNKQSAAKTGSFLFQNAFSGRAEIGLTGDDNLRLKVSSNGSTWTDAMTVKSTTGEATFKLQAFDAGVVQRVTDFKTNGVLRWRVGTGGNAETGANAGSPWFVQAFDDAGAYLGMPIFCDRQTASLKLPWIDFLPTGPVFYKPAKPAVDNAQSCGEATARWTTIYAATGTINTSDVRLKTDVRDCPLGLDFIRSLSPKLYRWKQGGNTVTFAEDEIAVEEMGPDGEMRTVRTPTRGAPIVSTQPGRRLHAGLLAQDVKKALDEAGVDCGVWVLEDKSDPDSPQSLRYDQFVAPLITAIKELAARVERLERSAAQG